MLTKHRFIFLTSWTQQHWQWHEFGIAFDQWKRNDAIWLWTYICPVLKT